MTALELSAVVAEGFVFTEGRREYDKLARSEGKVYIYKNEAMGTVITLGERCCSGGAGGPPAACEVGHTICWCRSAHSYA